MDAPQNSPAKQLQPITGKAKRTSTQTIPVQAAAIAKFSMNESKTQIAKDLGIARGTLDVILDSAEIEQTVLYGRSRAVSLIPKSLDVAEYRLSKNDGSMAIALLRGTKVLQNEQVVNNTQNNFAFSIAALKQESAERANESKQLPAATTTNSDPDPSQD